MMVHVTHNRLPKNLVAAKEKSSYHSHRVISYTYNERALGFVSTKQCYNFRCSLYGLKVTRSMVALVYHLRM